MAVTRVVELELGINRVRVNQNQAVCLAGPTHKYSGIRMRNPVAQERGPGAPTENAAKKRCFEPCQRCQNNAYGGSKSGSSEQCYSTYNGMCGTSGNATATAR